MPVLPVSARIARLGVLAIAASTFYLLPTISTTAQQPAASGTGTAGASAAQSSSASSGSSLPMESVALEYQALSESADQIADALDTSIIKPSPNAPIVIATNGDVGALIQLKALLGQADIDRA